MIEIAKEIIGFEEFSPQIIIKTTDLVNQKAYIWMTKRISWIIACNALEAWHTVITVKHLLCM